METPVDPLAVVFDADALAKENAALKAELAALKAPAPVRPLSRSEQKAALELKYARECRQETPNLTRSGLKIPVRGSANCADHSSAGKSL